VVFIVTWDGFLNGSLKALRAKKRKRRFSAIKVAGMIKLSRAPGVETAHRR